MDTLREWFVFFMWVPYPEIHYITGYGDNKQEVITKITWAMQHIADHNRMKAISVVFAAYPKGA